MFLTWDIFIHFSYRSLWSLPPIHLICMFIIIIILQIIENRLRPDDMTTQYLVGTLADYDETLKHTRQNLYDKLAEKLAERMLIEYLKALISRYNNYS